MMKFLRRVFLRGEYPAAPLLFIGRARWWRRPVLVVMRWQSPDGQVTARLEVPRDRPEDDLLRIYLDGDRIDELTLQPIWLGGRWGYIHSRGEAAVDVFDIQNSLKPHQPLPLVVGVNRQRWRPID